MNGFSCLVFSCLGPSKDPLFGEDPRSGREGCWDTIWTACSHVNSSDRSLWPGSGHLECSSPAHVHPRGPAPHWSLSFIAISGVWGYLFSVLFSCQVSFRGVQNPITISSVAFSLLRKTSLINHSILLASSCWPLETYLKYVQYINISMLNISIIKFTLLFPRGKKQQYSLGKLLRVRLVQASSFPPVSRLDKLQTTSTHLYFRQ